MAKVHSEDMVCDVCGTTSRVKSYTIADDTGAVVVDLCLGDAKPLLKLKEAGSTEPRRKTTKGNRSGHAVIPVD